MAKPKAKEWTADGVLGALRAGPMRDGAHSWLYEVGNATGWKCRRHADALVVSVWPSRGIWLAGVEAKVSRSDWKKELDDPKKSNEVQQYCHYWWVAAPEGVVELSEVPETWGLYEIGEGKRVKVSKQAPRLEPKPLDVAFVAAVMRNASEGQVRAIDNARNEAIRTLENRAGQTPDAYMELGKKLDEANRRVRQLELDQGQLERLANSVKAFERGAGLPEGTIASAGRSWNPEDDVGAHYSAALLLKHADRNGALARRFREVAEALEAARSVSLRSVQLEVGG